MPGACAIYVLTRQGLELALGLAPAVEGRIFAAASLRKAFNSGQCNTPIEYFKGLSELLQRTFRTFDRHIFISAVGIAVRCIAPLLASKTRDPAVLALDQRGRFAISLLSGHMGGANALAEHVAAVTGATPVITTATEVENLPAVDRIATERGLAIADARPVKIISAALLADRPVALHDPENRLGLLGSRWDGLFTVLESSGRLSSLPPDVPCIVVTEYAAGAFPPASNPVPENRLFLHPKALAAGVGCKRGTTAAAIVESLCAALHTENLSVSALSCLASVSIKADEAGLREAAETLGVPLRLFTPEELRRLPVTEPSAKAREVLNLDGVCEPAALAAAALDSTTHNARLLVQKTKGHGVTVALACPPLTFYPPLP